MLLRSRSRYGERRYWRAEAEVAVIEGTATPKQLARYRRRTRMLGAIAGIGLALGTGAQAVGAVQVLVPSDAQERTIESRIGDVVHTGGAKMSCVPMTQLRLMGVPFAPSDKVGAAIPGTGVMWLASELCDALTGEPIVASDLTAPELSAEAKLKLFAVHAAAHETGHALMGGNEPEAECIAIQLAPDLAVKNGMDPALKGVLQERLIDEAVERHKRRPDYDFDLASCRPGGGDDLSDLHIGTQIHFPSVQ